MTKTLFYSLLSMALLLSACSQKRPDAHPKHPKYEIIKPKVKYAASRKNLAKMVKQLQGSPYVWAEEGPDKFDCSGFTYYLYGSMGIEIPRVAREQAKVGKRIDVKDLEYGDLIFFATNRHNRRKITHVGMYLGDGWFTHASTVKNEVIYSNLYTSPYYKKRLRVCRRYLPEEPKDTLASAEIPAPVWQGAKTPITTPTPATPPLEERKAGENKKAIVIKAPIQEMEQQPTSQGTYYVQVGSFVGRPKSALLYMITRRGLTYKLIKFPKGDKRITKLLIGPYVTHEEAEKILMQVRSEIQKDAFIAQIK
jgi:cell division septation protein DedD